jgi:uncharacterized repeat protein (TIGR04052 family)
MKTLKLALAALFLMVAATNLNVQAHEGIKYTIRFAAKVGEKPVYCGLTYAGLGTTKTAVQINDFRFFVSEVRLIDDKGKEIPVTLVEDKLWQNKDVALLDFEDATAGCAESGTKETNNGVVIEANSDIKYTGLAFTLGIPFAANHQDPTAAAAPLNVAAMSWGWQYGNKFVRIDLNAIVNGKPSPWFIHLGSTGCVAAADTNPPKEECTNPNRVAVKFDKFDLAQNVVVADLANLLAKVNLNDNTLKPPGCMSGPDDPDCKALFQNGFALSLANGQTPKGSKEAFFRVE